MKELNNVVTLVDKENIKKGTFGTVVIYEDGFDCCLVEFCSEDGDSNVVEFNLDELEIIKN